MLLRSSFDQFQYALFMLISAIIVGALLGTAIVLSSPGFVILAIIGVLSVILVVKNPTWGILGFIALTSTLLSSDANPGVSIGVGHIYLTDLILFNLLWLIGWGMLTHLEVKFVRTPLDIPLLIFIAVALVSTINEMLRGNVDLNHMLGPARDMLSYLLFFAVTNLIKTDKQAKLLQDMIIAFTWIVSVVMIVQYITGTTLPFLPGRIEVLNTEGTNFSGVTRIIPPGYAIAFITFVIDCSIWFFDNKNSGNGIRMITLVLSGVGVLLTFKRLLWGALVFLLLIMALMSNRKEIQRILIRGFSTFAIMLVGLYFVMNYTGSKGPNLIAGSVDRMLSVLRVETYKSPDSSLRWRDFENYYASIQIAAHPFIGIGLGTRYRPWIPGRDGYGFDGRRFIHNGFYWLLLRTGGVGFLLMMGVMVVTITRGFKYWRVAPNGALMLGSTLAIIGMLMGNWVEPLISDSSWTGLIAILMGLNEYSIRSISKQTD